MRSALFADIVGGRASSRVRLFSGGPSGKRGFKGRQDECVRVNSGLLSRKLALPGGAGFVAVVLSLGWRVGPLLLGAGGRVAGWKCSRD